MDDFYVISLVFAAVVAGGLAVIPARIAETKGRDGGLWWLYGWLLFLPALIHALLLPVDQALVDDRALASGAGKACPQCAEVVKRHARVCKHCAYDFSHDLELEAQGWFPDPTGRHQRRLRSSDDWTERVLDDGLESVDAVWRRETDERLARERDADRLKEALAVRKRAWGTRLGRVSFWSGVATVACFVGIFALLAAIGASDSPAFWVISVVAWTTSIVSVVLCVAALVLGNRHWSTWLGAAVVAALYTLLFAVASTQ